MTDNIADDSIAFIAGGMVTMVSVGLYETIISFDGSGQGESGGGSIRINGDYYLMHAGEEIPPEPTGFPSPSWVCDLNGDTIKSATIADGNVLTIAFSRGNKMVIWPNPTDCETAVIYGPNRLTIVL